MIVEGAIIAAVFLALFLVIGLPAILWLKRKDSARAPNDETADSLRLKIRELERKRDERARLQQEVKVSRDLADVDTQLEELRKQLAEAETRESAPGRRS